MVGAAVPAVVMAWLVEAGVVEVLGVKPGGVEAFLPFWARAASWETRVLLVATNSALVVDSVEIILTWLSIVSALIIAAHARELKDSPSLVAISS